MTDQHPITPPPVSSSRMRPSLRDTSPKPLSQSFAPWSNLMTNHPITPPPELVEQWFTEQRGLSEASRQHIATRAAQWGADQELEACIDWISGYHGLEHPELLIELLRAARRPKPQTLNSIALQMLGTIQRDAHYLPEITDTIRRALESIHD